jgi:hypothetical protein
VGPHYGVFLLQSADGLLMAEAKKRQIRHMNLDSIDETAAGSVAFPRHISSNPARWNQKSTDRL